MIERFTWQDFDAAVENLARKIEPELLRIRNIYGIPRGGFILAVALSHRLDLPLVANKDHVGLSTLVVDDISDSGSALSRWKGNITVTIHIVEGTGFMPDYHYAIRKGSWVIYPWEKKED